MINNWQPSVDYNEHNHLITLTSHHLRLTIKTENTMNPCQLQNLENGFLIADSDYIWPSGKPALMDGDPDIRIDPYGSCRITLTGRCGPIQVKVDYEAADSEPDVIYETITIRNPSQSPADTAWFKCGFAKKILENGKPCQDILPVRFCPVPYRCGTGGEVLDKPLAEILAHGMDFRAWVEEPVKTGIWGSEGWVWHSGGHSFLVTKYNPDAMEWSLMEPAGEPDLSWLRFAGAGTWKYGNPVKAGRLMPGESFTFGETRLQAVKGDWQQAYYAYRGFMDTKGCRFRQEYDPPVHWNELYDNDYFFKICSITDQADYLAVNQTFLKKYYTLGDMKAEAEKAREIGCEALYMDPGWDTGPSHHIWDAGRLGSMASYVAMMRDEFGLKVSLWIGLNGVPPTYADPDACPPEARVIGPDGRPDEARKDYYVHCVASPAFRATKTERLEELCRNGIAFLMLDSTQFSGQCHDPAHGHGIPSNTEEHAASIMSIVQQVKKKYPQVLIEVHDFISGPSGHHYTPFYYGYARPDSFDCLWGHEFMWQPMADILSRRAVSLYYFNLACAIPIYLHINLKDDNRNALVFWWFASTCRHLGVGGRHPDPAVWEAHKQAMKQYRENKAFFVRGEFFGLDETVHAHSRPETGACVINCFNFDETDERKTLTVMPHEIGLPPGRLEAEGFESSWDGGALTISVPVPSRGHCLVMVRNMQVQPGKDENSHDNA